jgi:hypothetical protein
MSIIHASVEHAMSLLLCLCCALLQAWAELEAAEGQRLLTVKLLEQALAADRHHLPSWMVSSSCMCLVWHACVDACDCRYMGMPHVVKLLEQALAADRHHLPRWMVSSSCLC